MIKSVLIIIKRTSFFLDEGSNLQSSESCAEYSDSDTDSEAASDSESGSGSDNEEDPQTSSKVHLWRLFKRKQMTSKKRWLVRDI